MLDRELMWSEISDLRVPHEGATRFTPDSFYFEMFGAHFSVTRGWRGTAIFFIEQGSAYAAKRLKEYLEDPLGPQPLDNEGRKLSYFVGIPVEQISSCKLNYGCKQTNH